MRRAERTAAVRQKAIEVKEFLGQQLGRDVARLIEEIGAAQWMQAGGRGMLARRHHNPKISLKVVTQDGNEITFRLKRETPLAKLMNAFCQRQGVQMSSVRFLFDGQRINQSHTPKDVRAAPSPAPSHRIAALSHVYLLRPHATRATPAASDRPQPPTPTDGHGERRHHRRHGGAGRRLGPRCTGRLGGERTLLGARPFAAALPLLLCEAQQAVRRFKLWESNPTPWARGRPSALAELVMCVTVDRR